MSNPPHAPNDEQRRTVRAMVAYGVKQTEIADVIGIDAKTLRLHYSQEIKTASAEANAKVAQSLFNAATKDKSVAAMCFWLKTRARWRENEAEQNIGPDGKPMRNITIAITDPVEAAKAYQQLMAGEGDA